MQAATRAARLPCSKCGMKSRTYTAWHKQFQLSAWTSPMAGNPSASCHRMLGQLRSIANSVMPWNALQRARCVKAISAALMAPLVLPLIGISNAKSRKGMIAFPQSFSLEHRSAAKSASAFLKVMHEVGVVVSDAELVRDSPFEQLLGSVACVD